MEIHTSYDFHKLRKNFCEVLCWNPGGLCTGQSLRGFFDRRSCVYIYNTYIHVYTCVYHIYIYIHIGVYIYAYIMNIYMIHIIYIYIYTYTDHEMNRTFASVTSSARVGNTSRCAQRGGTLGANVPPMGCDRALVFTINPIIRPDSWLSWAM